MKPATCHFPEKFSNDAVKEIKTYAEDEANTPVSTSLVLKIGGGSARQGLGKGIHWHIENDIQFSTTDPKFQQDIPYVKVTDLDGKVKEYFDVGSNVTSEQMSGEKLVNMDCITCHNRVTHDIPDPSTAVDEAISKNLIPVDLPNVKKEAVALLSVAYPDFTAAQKALAGFEDLYAKNYPDIYGTRKDDVQKTTKALQDMYSYMAYPEQKLDWTTHPNNLGHKTSAGASAAMTASISPRMGKPSAASATCSLDPGGQRREEHGHQYRACARARTGLAHEYELDRPAW